MLVISAKDSALDTEFASVIKTHCVVSSSYSKDVLARHYISTAAFVRHVLFNAGYTWPLEQVDFTDAQGYSIPINDVLTIGEAAHEHSIEGWDVYINLKPGVGA